MRIGQFLKLDLKKIILLIIIFYLFGRLYLTIDLMNDKACIANGPIPGMIFPSWSCNIGFLLLFILFKPFEGFLHYAIGYYFPEVSIHLLTLITIPYYYLVACIIVWCCNRLLKKQKHATRKKKTNIL